MPRTVLAEEPLTREALNACPIGVPASSPPVLVVIVDTEETFDWDAPFARKNTDVRAMSKIGQLQAVFSSFGIRPLYVVDYPVAAQRQSIAPLSALLDRGICEIGAHLHPWVTPPFLEDVTPRNSFACNLPPALQAEKIERLTKQIELSFGVTPRAFKAGRYGLGVSTTRVLEDLDYQVDTSVNPRMDYTEGGGPSFAAFDERPFLFGTNRTMLELPCTAGFTGLFRRVGARVHPLLDRAALRPARLVGAAARLGLLNKVMLSPEGYRLDEMRTLVASSYAAGVRTFALTMHSPSIDVGCTPYVRSEADQKAFVDRITKFCEFFFLKLHGVTMSIYELERRLRGAIAEVDQRECA